MDRQADRKEPWIYRHQCPSSIPLNVIKSKEQNIYCSLYVITKVCYGKTRNTRRAEAFSIMFYAIFLEHEIRQKGRCQYGPKTSYFLSTWALRLEFDPNSTLVFTLISQQKWISVKVTVSLLWKKQDIIIHTKSHWFLLCTKGRLRCPKHFKLLELKSRKKKSWCGSFHYSSLFNSLKVAVLLLRN